MLGNDSDRTWQFFGAENPYFGVLTTSRFDGDLDPESRRSFFASGSQHVDKVLEAIHKRVNPAFKLRRALDFGCGVGRLVLPLARYCESVVGVDVSPGMLAEAEKNAREQGVEHASFVLGDDDLTQVEGTFDFVHSFIVFQHIPPERGERIIRALLARVNPGGVGALQLTFSHDAPLARRALIEAYRRVPVLFSVRNAIKGRPLKEPMMQMNLYNLNRELNILKECGAVRITVEFTETSHFSAPLTGAFLFFEKDDGKPSWGA
jgi:SAM-dependent methyltransferase